MRFIPVKYSTIPSFSTSNLHFLSNIMDSFPHDLPFSHCKDLSRSYYSWALRPQSPSVGKKNLSVQFGCLATAQIHFNLDIYVFGKMFCFFFSFFLFEKNTGTWKTNFLGFYNSHVI